MNNTRTHLFVVAAMLSLSSLAMAYGTQLKVLQSEAYLCHTEMNDLNFQVTLEESNPIGKPPTSRLIDYRVGEVISNSRKSADGIFTIDDKPIAKFISDRFMLAQNPVPKSWLPDGGYIMGGGGSEAFNGNELQPSLALDTQFPDLHSVNVEMKSIAYVTFDHPVSVGQVGLPYATSIHFEKNSARTGSISISIRAFDASWFDSAYQFYGLKALPANQLYTNLHGNCEMTTK